MFVHAYQRAVCGSVVVLGSSKGIVTPVTYPHDELSQKIRLNFFSFFFSPTSKKIFIRGSGCWSNYSNKTRSKNSLITIEILIFLKNVDFLITPTMTRIRKSTVFV